MTTQQTDQAERGGFFRNMFRRDGGKPGAPEATVEVAEERTMPEAPQIEIAPDGEKTLETALADQIHRTRTETAVELRHPAINEVAIVRKQNAQRLVNAE